MPNAAYLKLLDSSRKKTGGKIDIQVNLREPLTGEDIAKRSERWLVLDAFGSTVSECLSFAKLTVGGPQRPSAPSSQIQSESGTPNVPDQTPVAIQPETPAQQQQQQQQQPVSPVPQEQKQRQQEQTDKKATPDNSEVEAAEEEFNR